MNTGELRFIAHRTQDEQPERTQTIADHLSNTAELARGFAEVFGCGDFAGVAALAHDIGKYSEAFQKRINGGAARVDHSTAGARVLAQSNKNAMGLLAAYCVAGHHAGLPDGGSSSDTCDTSTLCGRLSEGRVTPDYSAFQNEITIPELALPGIKMSDGFSLAFFTRMIFSCLVDADFLDTERFMLNRERRILSDDMPELLDKLASYTKKFKEPERDIDILRTKLFTNCVAAADSPSGLFTLTAPTGSGKTLSSLAFALNHAMKNGQKRIIYVIPYNSIIEQAAGEFEKIFGLENVLQHHSGEGGDYGKDEYDNPNYEKLKATENWDSPLIVTSSVQFFESLFASRPSKCRKLHNIANSVIVFDEAQMLPPQYLLPCIKAIKELVINYKCSAVLATATQSSLDEYFKPLPLNEITSNPEELYNKLRRVSYEKLQEDLSVEELAEKLRLHAQVLCVVNTRKTAQELAKLLDGSLHLSTAMYPKHRTRTLDEIRRRLRDGENCRVVSTSMIEAGVDIDFPALYREKAGLDSIIQAGGRCNREGNEKDISKAVVRIFTLQVKTNEGIAQNIAAYDHAVRTNSDVAGIGAIVCYFERLRYIIGDKKLGKQVIDDFNSVARSCLFPFATVARGFRIIDDKTETVYVLHERNDLYERLKAYERTRDLFRELQQYAVSLYPADIKKINCFETLDGGEIKILLGGALTYDEKCGALLSPESGMAIIS